MEEKILAKLEQMENKMDNKIDNLQNQINDMNEKFEKRFDQLEEDNKNLQEKVNNLSDEVEEIRDGQFAFEHEYGTKIDAIFDVVTTESNKHLEESVKICKLDKRMDKCEANIFGHEKRISTLELNQ